MLHCIHHGNISPAIGLGWSTGETMQSAESRNPHKLPSVSTSLQSFLLPSFACHLNKTLKTFSLRWTSPLQFAFRDVQLLFWEPWLVQPVLPQNPLPYRHWDRKGYPAPKQWHVQPPTREHKARKLLSICDSEQPGRNDRHWSQGNKEWSSSGLHAALKPVPFPTTLGAIPWLGAWHIQAENPRENVPKLGNTMWGDMGGTKGTKQWSQRAEEGWSPLGSQINRILPCWKISKHKFCQALL